MEAKILQNVPGERSSWRNKGKGKGHPCTGTEALYSRTVHRGSRGIALLFLDHGTRREVRGKVHRCTGTEALYRPYGP